MFLYHISRKFGDGKIKRFHQKIEIKFKRFFNNYVIKHPISKRETIVSDTQYSDK